MSTNSATAFEGPMDPTDFVEYVHEFNALLESNETIEPGFTVTPSVEAAALGFEVSTVFPPSTVDAAKSVQAWYQVNPSSRNEAAFSDDGIQVEVEVTATTSLQRRYQRTWLITVKQL